MSAPKTPIEKSHSKWSNFKLTLLSLAAAVGFCAVFAAMGLRPWLPDQWVLVTAGAGAAVTALTAVGFCRFTR